MKKLIILTDSELRHTFFRKYLAQAKQIQVLKTYCEANENGLDELVKNDPEHSLRRKHLLMREQSEKDFFELYVEGVADLSQPDFIPKGEINQPEYVQKIIELNPDLIVAYGCSIIRPALIDAFAGRFLNVHLGLSPFYRGAGTNFWPFVNNEPEYVGVSFLHIDSGVDTGAIIHQIQANINYGDNIHQVGNRLIKDMACCCAELVRNFEQLESMEQKNGSEAAGKVYRKKDFTDDSVALMYSNFANGLVDRYLEEKQQGKRFVSIIQNPALIHQTVSV